MVSSDLAKSGLISAALIDGYDHQNKDKTHYHYEKNKRPLFFRAVYHNKNHAIPHPVIAAIWTSS